MMLAKWKQKAPKGTMSSFYRAYIHTLSPPAMVMVCTPPLWTGGWA